MPRIVLIIVFVFSTGNGVSQDITSDIIAHYTFSGNALDDSGNHNDGSVVGATLTADRLGNPNRAYKFDGNSYISLPPALVTDNLSFTISAWVRIDALPTQQDDHPSVISYGSQVSDTSYSVTINHITNFINYWGMFGYVRYPINWEPPLFSGIIEEGIGYSDDPATGVWFHIVHTSGPRGATLYLYDPCNAAEVYFYDTPLIYNYPNANFLLGMRSDKTTGFHGVIDDVTIYDREFTVADVASFFSVRATCIPLPPEVHDVAVCGPAQVSLTAEGGEQYNWYDSPTGGTYLFGGNPFRTPVLTTTTSYYVSATLGIHESARSRITVSVNPALELVCALPDHGEQGTPLIFSVSEQNGTPPVTFGFNFGDGDSVVTASSDLTHRYSSDGTFKVTAKATDVNGCVANCTSVISIHTALTIPDVITSNGDTLNHLFAVYVKKSNGRYMNLKTSQPFQLNVYNRWGESVYATTESTDGWDGGNALAGTYYYLIRIAKEEYKGVVSLIR